MLTLRGDYIKSRVGAVIRRYAVNETDVSSVRLSKEDCIQAAIDSVEGNSQTYLEIGVNAGASFFSVDASVKVGVDPHPELNPDLLPAGQEIVVQESDSFFASALAPRLLGGGVDVALVDGLHEFGQAWRDIVNASKYMNPGGYIIVDDCCPRDEQAAQDVRQTSYWNGDVWKVMAMVRATQPQWRALTLDADEGVGIIWNLDLPIAELSASQVDHFKQLTYEDLDRDRAGQIGLTPPRFLPQDLGFARLLPGARDWWLGFGSGRP